MANSRSTSTSLAVNPSFDPNRSGAGGLVDDARQIEKAPNRRNSERAASSSSAAPCSLPERPLRRCDQDPSPGGLIGSTELRPTRPRVTTEDRAVPGCPSAMSTDPWAWAAMAQMTGAIGAANSVNSSAACRADATSPAARLISTTVPTTWPELPGQPRSRQWPAGSRYAAAPICALSQP